jgi:amino acid adenylation domain-containing protein/non-ribosomal peptide synthase protein (TIGR01720 family)
MTEIGPFIATLRKLGVKLSADSGHLRYQAPKGSLDRGILEQMKQRKEEILAYLKQARQAVSGPVPAIQPVSRQGSVPLSFAQQRLWFLYQLEGPKAAYNILVGQRISGKLNVTILELCFREMGRRHETLRTHFSSAHGESIQVVAPTFEMELPVLDLTGWASAEQDGEVQRLVARETRWTFDLERGPLWRLLLIKLSENEHLLYLTMHHIISDGWSLGILIHEITRLYEAFSCDQPSPLTDLPIQYADFACWQRQWLRDQVLESHTTYWKQKLAGAPGVLALPSDRPRPVTQSYRGASERICLSPDLTLRLKELGQRSGATLYMTVLAAFKILLSRYCGQQDVVVGTQVANRNLEELEPLIGFFINTLALRTSLRGNPSFVEFLGRVRQTALDAFAHQELPFEKLVELLQPERNLAYHPVVQVMFLWQNTPKEILHLPGLSLSPIEIERATAKFDLTLELGESEEGVAGVLEYNTDLFDAKTMVRMALHFSTLLEAIVARPKDSLSKLPMLTDAEQHQLLVTWNETRRDISGAQSLQELFERQAEQTPDAVAVVCSGKQLTYRELNVRANQLAHHLRSLGVGPEIPVGLCLERSVEMLVGVLGILKAGGAYVPLDPASPPERLILIVAEAGLPVVVTQQKFTERFFKSPVRRIAMDNDRATLDQNALSNPVCPLSPDHLAYVIYTSGSTGQPKGVMIEHRSVVNLVAALEETVYSRYPGPLRVALIASLVFDASVQQIFAVLLHGHTLFVVDEETRRDGVALAQYFQTNAIDIADCTPSLLNIMVATAGPRKVFQSLKHLIVGGEALPRALVEAFYEKNPSARTAITNIYGPTECCVDVTQCTMHPGSLPSQTVVPIGRPLINTQIYVLDPEGILVPSRVPGEIWIAGAGVGRGYLHQPALTAEKFRMNPFRSHGRIYRTGDLGRWTGDGDIEFLGRNDDQVKVRGYRIELGEIEHHLRLHPRVRDAVVLIREMSLGQRELVAYLLLKSELTVSEMRSYVREKLPDYMVPTYFLTLESFPLNSSGKVDRRALPKPEAALALKQGIEYMGPRDEQEQRLVEVWQAVLGRDKIGIKDNFFALGGDSIKALQIAARLRESNFRLEIRNLFLFPTVEELAPHLQALAASEIADEIVVGPVPLTAIQRWFFREFGGSFHHFNQAILLSVAERLEEKALETAWHRLHAHHDVLGMRYRQVAGTWVQEIGNPNDSSSVVWMDLREVENPAAALTAHASALQSSFNLESGPLFKAVVYRLPESDRLFLVAHHLVVDAVSWRIILEDLKEVYRHAQAGRGIRLPNKTTSFKRWAERIQEWAQRGVLDERPYWRRLESQAVSPLPDDFRVGEYRATGRSSCCLKLSSEETTSLLTRIHQAYNTEINDILLTALARALQQWHGMTRSVIFLEGHGRESLFDDLDISRTVGWFTSLYPVMIDLGSSPELGQQIRKVKETLRRIPRKGVGYGILRYISEPDKREGLTFSSQPEVCFNYLGQFGKDFNSDLFSRATEDIGASSDPRAASLCKIEVLGVIFESCLELVLNFSTAHFHEATIRQLLSNYKSELIQILRHAQEKDQTELSPSDIDYDGFDIEQLDNFMENLSQK